MIADRAFESFVHLALLLGQGLHLLVPAHQKRQVEVNLRHLKTTMKMDILRSQTAAGIEKELWMFLIVYNLERLIVLEASEQQRVAAGRISFADALYWVRHGDLRLEMPEVLLVSERPNRVEPRVMKRRTQEYPLLKKPREVLRKALMGRRR